MKDWRRLLRIFFFFFFLGHPNGCRHNGTAYVSVIHKLEYTLRQLFRGSGGDRIYLYIGAMNMIKKKTQGRTKTKTNYSVEDEP